MSYLAYSRAASYFHWVVAFPLIASVATVLQAQSAPKEQKGELMRRHKSLGLLTAMLVAPRVAYRLLSRSSYDMVPLVGNTATENVLANINHKLLYGFMIIMPASGVAMGYYGGKGLPFFGTTFASALPANDEQKKQYGQIAKQSFGIHKQIGTYGKYLIPIHVGATGLHFAKGQRIFARINPFRKPTG